MHPRAPMSRTVASLAAITILCGASCTSQAHSTPDIPTGSFADQNGPARTGVAGARCNDLPSGADLKTFLRKAPATDGEAGGLFSGQMEWAAVVDREGRVCSTSVATDDPATAWPGSQAIAKAKAYTANAYSTDTMPLSTARLYTLSQPGHSLWGIAQPNPFNQECIEAPHDMANTYGKICGGTIAFGGGVPLYKGRMRVGGLGVSGDTACTDHEIAKRIRHLASLDPEKGELADDIIYDGADGPSPFAHPLCENTWRNGKKIGEEKSD
jgi:uncharacterized protein GlcG (DUF336 family)